MHLLVDQRLRVGLFSEKVTGAVDQVLVGSATSAVPAAAAGSWRRPPPPIPPP